ncbi:trichohyalin-like [Chanos chanos]|uniref:Trichohyalin-like n=1 Tax=Chanos chanos TaxID=29144 RepID=A0A6J2UUH3_CHACN|nr:trichohyalin-like [Chanos chanos]
MDINMKNPSETNGDLSRFESKSDQTKHIYSASGVKAKDKFSVTKNVKPLLEEFKRVYEEKLRRVEYETQCGSLTEMLRMKIRILHSYVNDMSDQNQVLVQTVEDLEKEANQRVVSLEEKLRTADKIISDLDHHRKSLEEDSASLLTEIQELKSDVGTLTQVSGVNLRTVSLEKTRRTSAPSSRAPRLHGDRVRAQVDDLRSQLKAKNRIIQSLEEEIKTLLFKSPQRKNEAFGQSESVLLLQGKVEALQKLEMEKVAVIADKDITIARLQTELQVGRQDARNMQNELSRQGKRVKELQAELAELRAQSGAPVRPGTELQAQERAVNLNTQSELVTVPRPAGSATLRSRPDPSRNHPPTPHPSLPRSPARSLLRVERCALQMPSFRLEAGSEQAEGRTARRHWERSRTDNMDNGGPLAGDQSHWHDAFVSLKLDFAQLEERHLQALAQPRQDRAERAEPQAEEAAAEMNEREESLRRVRLDLSSLQADQESMRKSLTVKEQISSQLSQERDGTRHALRCLQNKLQASEEKVNSLGLEVSVLKSKLQEKTEQSQQLQDQILKQQEVLSRANETLKDTRKAAGNKINRREHKIASAQKALEETKKQLTDCQNQLLRRDGEVEKLQEENSELTAQMRKRSQDIHTLNSEKRKLEMEMTVITEKHRTAEEEVSRRDQVILQLRTELRTAEEKYQGALEELGLHEAEVSSLNERLRRQQSQILELTETCRQGDKQLDQEGQEKQQLLSQLQISQQKIKRQTEFVDQLQKELAAVRQSHTVDMERWNQKSVLLQSQLEHKCTELEQNRTQVMQLQLDTSELRNKLSQTQTLQQETLAKMEEDKELLRKQTADMLVLQKQLEKSLVCAQSNADIFKQKYTTAMEKVQQLQGQIQSLEEDVQFSSKQVLEAEEVVNGLRAQICGLEASYEQKVKQMENSEEAIDQLTEELQTALDNLKKSEDRTQECERQIERLKVEVGSQQKRILDHERKYTDLQQNLTSYQFTHSYTNADYEAALRQCGCFEKELATVKLKYSEDAQRLTESERTVVQLRAEALGLGEELRRKAQENQRLEHSLQNLHMDLTSAQHKYKQGLSKLEEDLAWLQEDLGQARNTSFQKDQAIKQKEDLLVRTETELAETRKALGEKVQEAEELREEVNSAKRDKQQKEKENHAMRREADHLDQQLQELQSLYADAVQALTGQEKRTEFLECSLRTAEEQLSELKKSHIQLTTAQEQFSQLQQMLAEMKTEASVCECSLRKALEDAAEQQRQHRAERDQDRELTLRFSQQVEQQEELVCKLRQEVKQEQTHSQEQQTQLCQLKDYITDMEKEMERLRMEYSSNSTLLRQKGGCVSRLEAELAEQQEKQKFLEEKLQEKQAQLRESCLNTAITDRYREQEVKRQEERIAQLVKQLQQSQRMCQNNVEELASKEEQCVVVKTEWAAFEEKYKRKILEVLHRHSLALEESRADNSHLHHQSQLLLTNIHHWIKEHNCDTSHASRRVIKARRRATPASGASESRGLGGEEQGAFGHRSRHIQTVRRSYLQERKDAMEVELQTLRKVADEREKEIDLLKLGVVCAESERLRRLAEKERARRVELELLLEKRGAGGCCLTLSPASQEPSPPGSAALTRWDLEGESERGYGAADNSCRTQGAGELSTQPRESSQFRSGSAIDPLTQIQEAEPSSPMN